MHNWRAHGLLLLTASLWGGSNVAQQNVLHYLGPFTIVGLRCLLASFVILPFVWVIKPNVPHVLMSGKWLIVSAALLFGLGTVLAQIGIGQTSVTNASFFVNTWTVMVPFCVWMALGIRPKLLVLPAAGLTLFGTCMMGGGTFGTLNSGDLLCVLAAFVFTCWGICMSEFVRKFHNPLLITLAQFVVTGFICTVLGFLYEPISFAGLVAALPDLLLLGVFSTGLGYILQAIAQSKTSLSAATIILSLEAVFGAVAGVLLLDEVVSPLKLFGALLILAGVMVVQFASETKSGSAKVTAAIASHTKSSLFQ